VIEAGAAELARRIRAREASPVEVVAAFRARPDPVNAIVTPAPDAEERAREAEAAVLRGDDLGPLHGVPFTAKDTLDTAGLRTTRGSLLFADHVPERDAAAVARLKEAGAILLGKTNTPEFALWWETDNRVFGRTSNPWNAERTAGGSSGGEAAALAAGLTPLGLGSDLGGSIRLPAHCCGVVGLKPTHGRVPLEGHWPETLLHWMHVGPLARSVEDAALAFGVLSPGPSNTVLLGFPDHSPRIGVAAAAFGPLDDDVAAAVAAAAEVLGAEPEELDLPDCDLLTRVLYGAGSRAYFDEVVAGRWKELHPFLHGRLTAVPASAEALGAAGADLERLRRELDGFFERFDLLLGPTAPSPAGRHGETERRQMRATIPFDLSGSPALSVPFGRSADGLPIGVQLVGRRGDDELVLATGALLERAAPYLPLAFAT
jgi:Asp-tRNA(Asn)/Glu-tRNA(Gln) amidotransferase A subunit family amidase